jgi:hypothetical protein
MDGRIIGFIIRYCVYLCYIIKIFFFVVINLDILIYYEYLSY